MEILGILNVTRDSFSDGGRYLSTEAAVTHARTLIDAGADIVDVGAESTHPDAEDVSAEEEVRRLRPVVEALRDADIRVSVDTYKPAVIREMLALGVEFINDVTGLADAESRVVLADSDARTIVMHSTAASARAERRDVSAETIVDRVVAFFEQRVAELEAAGVGRSRLIVDPGMGFFLGRDPMVSVAVLRGLGTIGGLGLPVCVSTSRKSFIGALLRSEEQPRDIAGRGAGTLATELWAAAQGAAYIRTHDPGAFCDAWRVWKTIAQPGGGG